MANYTNFAGMLPQYSNGGMVDPYANAVSGGLGTMYGIQGLEQQKQDAEQEAAIQALKFQEMQKDVPLKDIQRQVGMGRGKIDLGDIASGDAAAASKAALGSIVSKADLESTQASLAKKIEAAREIAGISEYLAATPGQLAANEDYLRDRFKKIGIKFPGLDAGSRADTLKAAEAMKLMLPEWQKQAAETAAQIARYETVGKAKQEAEAQTRKEVADIQGKYSVERVNASSNNFKNLQQAATKVATSPGPLTPEQEVIVALAIEENARNDKQGLLQWINQNPDEVPKGASMDELKEIWVQKRVREGVEKIRELKSKTTSGESKPTESQPPRPAGVPPNFEYHKNGSKGEGWYKPGTN